MGAAALRGRFFLAVNDKQAQKYFRRVTDEREHRKNDSDAHDVAFANKRFFASLRTDGFARSFGSCSERRGVGHYGCESTE